MSQSVIIQGFTVVPFKTAVDRKSLHYLYVKSHNVRESRTEKPKDRTLFVLNIPPYCHKKELENLFSNCGVIERIYLHSKPTSGLPPTDKSKFFQEAPLIKGYKVAYIVFRKASSVNTARNLAYDNPLILTKQGEPPLNTGLQKWVKEYNSDTADPEKLKDDIDNYMAEFDAKVQEEIERAKEQDGVPDEDGWVTVTRHGKNKAAPRTEHQEKVISRKEKKRRKEKELLNFYSFQLRDTKREQIATLRKKFEEDKQKISLMKASRKFKPY